MAGKTIQDNAVMLNELNKQTNFDSFRKRPAIQGFAETDESARMNLREDEARTICRHESIARARHN